MKKSEVSVDVDGAHPPVRIKSATRRGIRGVIFLQGSSRVWCDLDAWETLIEGVDLLIENTPRLGKIVKFGAK